MIARYGRVLLPVMLGLALPAAVTFLAYSVVHLIGSATTFHVRVVAPENQGLHPSAAVIAKLQANQTHWGDLAMFAVAIFAACLMLTLVTWLLGTQPRRAADRR